MTDLAPSNVEGGMTGAKPLPLKRQSAILLFIFIVSFILKTELTRVSIIISKKFEF